MGRIVQFNAQNWELIINSSSIAGILSENTYIPIPPLESAIFLESSIIACYVTTNIPDGKNWRWGGYCEQRFQSGLTVGGNTDAASEPKSIYLDKITTLFFPKISAQYSLKFYFPKWFKSVSLQCWQYTGIDETDENILLVQEFANINFKLDQLTANNP
ncbi:hypothetical protein FJR38_26905 [Anabaena sp. UHCC 0253]|uniref:hypothetical protein n=1 Tax=Anabaena sp. UHCC 0253 TaxID=2590019 RepID=UPI001447B71A|nr:hypothetical protein [Anabaena sp. UHCC 0253]MTJ56020.1 hypothetical protein [Anabaena sp. UHCC 0253]